MPDHMSVVAAKNLAQAIFLATSCFVVAYKSGITVLEKCGRLGSSYILSITFISDLNPVFFNGIER